MINNNKPTLSIIVPIYKVEEYLERCIDSILNQPYNDFELILVDDGSPDSCGRICDDYALKDDRVVVIHKENGGLSSARNAGIDIAKGDYLSFIDSDDYISDTYYNENMQFLLSNPTTDMAIMQVCYIKGKDKKTVHNKRKELKSRREAITFLMSKDYICSAWINIYKRNIFETLRYPEGKIYEDGFILPDVIHKINNIFVSDKGIYYYILRDESIMQKRKSLNDCFDILDAHTRMLDFCYRFEDNKKLFLNKYVAYHLPLIYSFLQFPNFSFVKYREKYESFDFTINQLIFSGLPAKSIIKLFLLKKIGFLKFVKIYKIMGIVRYN